MVYLALSKKSLTFRLHALRTLRSFAYNNKQQGANMGVRLRCGEYHYQFQVDGKQYTGNTGEADKREASEIANAIKQAIRRGLDPATIKQMFSPQVADRIIEQTCPEGAPQALPLEEAYNMWDQGDAAQSTRSSYMSIWNEFVHHVSAYGASTCSDVTASMVNRWIGPDAAPNTKRQKLAIVRSIMRSADREFADALFRHVNRPRSKQVYHREVLTEEQISVLRENLEGEDLIMFTLGLELGLRLGDAALLKRSQIDLDACSIHVRTAKRGKVVAAPISERLSSMVYSYIKNHDSEYVCPEYAEQYSKKASYASARYRKAIERVGINATARINGGNRSVLGFHALRHTYAYYALLSGVPAQFVMEMIGHSVFNQTLHYAGHGTLKHKAEALKGMWNRI